MFVQAHEKGTKLIDEDGHFSLVAAALDPPQILSLPSSQTYHSTSHWLQHLFFLLAGAREGHKADR